MSGTTEPTDPDPPTRLPLAVHQPPPRGLGWLSSIADVVLGRSCAGCDAPGIALCEVCADALAPKPRLRRSLDLTDMANGLQLPVVCSLDYRGPVRQVLYRFKDHRVAHLARPLAPALAASIGFAAQHAGVLPVHTTLTPMPTRRSTARRRGFDPLGSVVEFAIRQQRVAAVRTPLVDTRRAGGTKRTS
jgi:predicted amidophosphoribosyltransferase